MALETPNWIDPYLTQSGWVSARKLGLWKDPRTGTLHISASAVFTQHERDIAAAEARAAKAEGAAKLYLEALRWLATDKALSAETIREMATDWLAAWEPHCTCANKLRPWHENACPALNPAGPTAAKGVE